MTRLARSAPEKPGVPRAITRASTSGASGTFFMWTWRICSRPSISGRGTTTMTIEATRRANAGSSTSGRLVAAMMMMPSLASNPSISTSNWFNVCSRSSLPLPNLRRDDGRRRRFQSMKTMHGADFFACSNIVANAACADATNISTKSDPEMAKNGTPASPAMARASRVLPVRGCRLAARLSESCRRAVRTCRILQIFDDFLKLFARFVDAGDVGEGYLTCFSVSHLGAALAEAIAPPPVFFCIWAHDEDRDADHQDERQAVVEEQHPKARTLLALDLDLHALADQERRDGRIGRRKRVNDLPSPSLPLIAESPLLARVIETERTFCSFTCVTNSL